MKKQATKLNIIDVAAVAVVLLVVAIFGFYYLNKPEAETTKLRVSVEVSDTSQVQIIEEQAAKDDTVYLNSVDAPVAVSSVAKQGEKLIINLEGPGRVDERGQYIFNGQRILIGQKAEIHANYFAQGKITAVENAY